MNDLRAAGTTILLTTHYMDEAQVLADRVAVISGGAIVAEGTPRHHRRPGYRTRPRIHFTLPEGSQPTDLPVEPSSCQGRQVTIEVDDPTAALHALTGWAMQRGSTLPGPGGPTADLGGGLLAAHRGRAREPGGLGGTQQSSPGQATGKEPAVTTANTAAPAPPRRRSALALLAHQVHYEQLSFWRNPQSAFFTFVFPVVLILIFGRQ